jgi:hypothetical protein
VAVAHYADPPAKIAKVRPLVLGLLISDVAGLGVSEMRKSAILVPFAALLLVAPVASAAAQPTATSALVTVGSPTGQHPQNAQNEPSLAVDASRPTVLAAGSNDLVDMQPCSRQASTTAGACSFPLGTFNLGVGLSAVYFSFDSGHSWIQPTYSGLTAADCSPHSRALYPACRANPYCPELLRERAALTQRHRGGIRAGPRRWPLLLGERLATIFLEHRHQPH